MAPTDDDDLIKCSFCGKNQKQVNKIIAGPDVYICDGCIAVCSEILGQELVEADSRMTLPADTDDLRTKLQPIIDLVIAGGTIAGSPDMQTSLRQAVTVLSRGDVDRIVETAGDSTPYVQTLLAQGSIWDKVPLRIKAVCAVCGSERIIDPVRRDIVRKERQSHRMTNAVTQVSWRDHPWKAMARVTNEALKDDSEPLICFRCDGDAFICVPTTFCPQCKKHRDEDILVKCPDCEFDFVNWRVA